ncbi:MAG TPA: YndJ family transporter [Roseiflexaceae bacterium]|nr:YndJ family transporter [Roseiflexaceae bacterium]
MNFTLVIQPRITRISALAGGVVWAIVVVLPTDSETTALIVRLLLLAVLVFVPIALGLAAPSDDGRGARLLRLAERIQPIAAAISAIAFFVSAGAIDCR